MCLFYEVVLLSQKTLQNSGEKKQQAPPNQSLELALIFIFF